MTIMYIDFYARSEKVNFDFSDLISCGNIDKNNIGDVNKRRNVIILDCNWSCITEKKHDRYIDSNDLLREFFEKIQPNLEQIKERINRLNLDVGLCVVVEKECAEDDYSLTVSKEMIHFLNEINASLEFDLYIEP